MQALTTPSASDRSDCLIARLRAAASANGELTVIGCAATGPEIAQVLNRPLAASLAGEMRSSRLEIEFASPAVRLPIERFGADEIRQLIKFDAVPRFGPNSPNALCRPVGELALDRFADFFKAVFEPAQLGLGTCAEIAELARRLHAGRPIEGRTDYRGTVIELSGHAAGLLFLAGSGATRRIGFMGVEPRLRKNPGMRAVLAAGTNWISDLGVVSLLGEVALANPVSMRFVKRLGGRVAGSRIIYRF